KNQIHKALVTATLVALCVLATNTHAAYTFCCRRYVHRKIPFSEIKGFSVQRSTVLCPINAIIFHTNKGNRCADSTQEWVMDYVRGAPNSLRTSGLMMVTKSQSNKYIDISHSSVDRLLD
uniref:C-C motif chemokine n=1 Tax=Poecilia latipinna TaxID=48699 RepID=A0A3B3V4H5_9TELE